MDRPILERDIFLSYYGDDFTGSADVMESLALNGIPSALFLEAPEQAEVEQFRLKTGLGARDGSQRLKAFGVAGMARSWSPAMMDQHLPAILEKISRIPADFFQFKICSTFDSSPEVGNIGHAAEIALRYFPSEYIPLLVGAPFLNRFVVFGNLFARVQDVTYRLDRHPTMSRHPVTPMLESDLRRHLACQTSREVRLIDYFGLNGAYGPVPELFKHLTAGSGHYLLFDTLDVEQLYTIGALLIGERKAATQLIVGASGANYALAFHLQQQGRIKKPPHIPDPGPAGRMVVVTGSCSPATAGQLAYMESLGHSGIRLDAGQLIRSPERGKAIRAAIDDALRVLANGKIPLLYSARGPDDPSIQQTRHQLSLEGKSEILTGELLAGAQGMIVKELIAKTGKMRVVVAGGDTSGYVARALGIYALETLCPIAPGAPLCIAHSRDSRFDGLEIALKGGQNGNERYFASVQAGRPLS